MTSKADLNTNIISVVVALAVMSITFWTISTSFRYSFGSLLFFLTFLICRILLSERSQRYAKLTLNPPYATRSFFLLIWLLSIIMVLLVNPFGGTQYVEWSEISLPNWLRLIAALLMTSFYPGYAILTVIGKNEEFSFLGKVTLSTFLSLFMSGLIAFIATMSEGLVGNQGLLGMVLLNILLLTLFSIFHTDKQRKFAKISIFSSQLIMMILILFVLTASYFVNFPVRLVPTIDQWVHYGSVLKAIDGVLFSTPGVYPYWSHMYAALFGVLSGFPLVNAFMTLLLLFTVLPILSFYLMCSSLFPSSKMPIVATVVYALFSGFGGLYVMNLSMTGGGDPLYLIYLASTKTSDMFYWLPSFRVFFFLGTIGFSTLFVTLYLLGRRFSNPYVKISLMATLFALGYLAHIAEALFFIVMMPFILLFARDFLKDPKDLPISVALGLVFVSIVDLSAPTKIYLFRDALYTPLFLCGLLGWMFLSFLLLRLNLRVRVFAKAKSANWLYLEFSPILVAGLVYIYVLCLIIWSYEIPKLSFSWGTPLPWYVYPIRLGAAGFITIASIPWLVKHRNSVGLRLPLLFVILFLLLGKASSYLSVLRMSGPMIPMPLAESRIMEFTWIGVSALGSYSIVKFFQHIHHAKTPRSKIAKTIIATSLLSLIAISGISSTFYAVELRSQPSNSIAMRELEDLNFLRSHKFERGAVLAPSSSASKLDSFGGMVTVHEYYRPAFFGATKAESLFDLLTHNIYQTSGFPIRYLFVSNSDLNEVRGYRNSFLFNHLMQYLSILFTNEETTIYEIPPFAPPSQQSNLTIIIPSSPTEMTYLYPLEVVSLAGLNYTVSMEFDSRLFTYSKILFPYDPVEVNLNNYLQWLSEGGSLIVLDSLGSHGSFATLLSLNITATGETYEANGVLGPKGEITTPHIDTPIFFSRERNVEPMAFYTNDRNSVSPYAFRKKVGAGELIYVEVYPYFTALQQMKGSGAGRYMFAKLGDLLTVLGVSRLKRIDLSEPIGRAILYGQTDLTGKLALRPSSFYIPAMDGKLASTIGWRKDNFSQGWSIATDNPANGTVYVNANENVTQVTFNAISTEVWQYFYVQVPSVDVSKYPYLILREKIEIDSYDLGHLRVVINGNPYLVRDWTTETKAPGHPWKTYIFNLHEAVKWKEGTPAPPRGSLTQIFWTGTSRGTEGGSGELYLDFIMLSSSATCVPDLGKRVASLDFSCVNKYTINRSDIDAPRELKNVNVLDFQLEGAVKAMLSGPDVQLTGTGLGVYSKGTFSRGFNGTVWIPDNATAYFTLKDEHEIFNVTARGGYFNMSVSTSNEDLIVYMANVRVTATGLARFEKAFVSTPYKVLCLNSPMEVDGQANFVVNTVDEGFVLISGLKVDGKYTVFIPSESNEQSEWKIPWASVVTSPYHILLLICISIILVAYHRRSRTISKNHTKPERIFYELRS